MAAENSMSSGDMTRGSDDKPDGVVNPNPACGVKDHANQMTDENEFNGIIQGGLNKLL